ncbi:TPA: hypothetical protein G8O12_005237 [Salmonella enterica]|uniref:Uncharacterized protein n=1 Tax=Salmonella enterica TaxID=28901 RepID=A0A742L2M9_SALER|nr:hypothetical protein [Salmonella enterica]HAF4642510.1 hypothetical protein [Salmonella enterica]HAF4748089.1 hypothetical protein [Salmonella enterica]
MKAHELRHILKGPARQRGPLQRRRRAVFPGERSYDGGAWRMAHPATTSDRRRQRPRIVAGDNIIHPVNQVRPGKDDMC